MPLENQFNNLEQEQSQPKSKNILIWTIFLVVVLAVGGVLIYFLVKEKGETTEKEPQTESEETTLDTSDWQTYRNEEYGFEFRYPNVINKISTIKPDSITRGVFFSSEHGSNIRFDFSNLFESRFTIDEHQVIKGGGWTYNPGDNLWYKAFPPSVSGVGISEEEWFSEENPHQRLSWQEMFEYFKSNASLDLDIVETESDQTAFSYQEGTGATGTFWQGYYIFDTDNLVFLGFQYTVPDYMTLEDETKEKVESERSEIQETLREIVKTVKIFEPEEELDTSDWQTYRHEEYGFEFWYPTRFNLNIVAEDFNYPYYVHECFNAELIPENESSSQFQFRINCSGVGLGTTTKQRDDLIDGREAQRSFPGGYLDWEYPLTGSKKIVIRYFRPDYNLVFWGHEINNEKDEELFNQIISTFKFLD